MRLVDGRVGREHGGQRLHQHGARNDGFQVLPAVLAEPVKHRSLRRCHTLWVGIVSARNGSGDLNTFNSFVGSMFTTVQV